MPKYANRTGVANRTTFFTVANAADAAGRRPGPGRPAQTQAWLPSKGATFLIDLGASVAPPSPYARQEPAASRRFASACGAVNDDMAELGHRHVSRSRAAMSARRPGCPAVPASRPPATTVSPGSRTLPQARPSSSSEPLQPWAVGRDIADGIVDRADEVNRSAETQRGRALCR